MKTATCQIRSLSPYSQSKFIQSERDDKESASDFEKRCWRERCHGTVDGQVFIPPMAFKNCIAEAARYLSVKIPGKRNNTYTKHFEAGVLVMNGPVLNLKVDDVEGEWLFVNADGKRGSGTRVMRCYPVIREWKAEVVFFVLDETVTEDVFRYHLENAGSFIGIGRFRPRNNGYYGRFQVEGITWSEAGASMSQAA